MNIEPLSTIGILGGMSSAATAEYYRLINQKVNQTKGGHHIAEMLITSVNFANIERFVRGDLWEEAGEYLVEKAQGLEKAGASCLFLATNTMHRVREDIKASISIPFMDIFETVSQVIRSQGLKKVGILGTYPVMTDAFYQQAYGEWGVELVSPTEEEKREIDRILFDEMTRHQFLPSSKAYFLQVIQNLAQQGAEGVILGCTEIKLLISQADIPEVPLFDTTELHCELAARICLGEEKLHS
ncbi:MAG: amino acid racemase [Bacteroidota bacterium]